MKRLILFISTFIFFISQSHSIEANIKIGYDGYQGYTAFYGEHVHGANYLGGYILGLEFLPFTFKDYGVKIGAGIEYDFTLADVKYENNNNELKDIKNHYIPLYSTLKLAHYTKEEFDLNIYTFYRLGYVFSRGQYHVSNGTDFDVVLTNDGIYYGAGFGLDYKYFLAEFLYESSYTGDEFFNTIGSSIYQILGTTSAMNGQHLGRQDLKSFHKFTHKLGIRLGFQIGTKDFKKPQIIVECPEHETVLAPKTVKVEKGIEVANGK